ncbi:F-box and wd40 domain protein [Reticulomyxa filosa]|uniref:F-box and wd40 domain protein n=1 Tax=Reticulomyxa filosa TaxID=46433 RepID=X6NJL3_RETFI|nr:F-box and wd40 domain protein [Reticulomyxa filosa]|eukprot:ETO26113.1 F-box and wd40 domain protein [Reticulomyxa filosa]
MLPNEPKILSCLRDDNIRICDISLERKIQLTVVKFPLMVLKLYHIQMIKQSEYYNEIVEYLWDISSGKQLFSRKLSVYVIILIFSPDGITIVSCLDYRTIELWDVLTGKQIQILKGHSDDICGIKFSLDGSKIILYSRDKTIQTWNGLQENKFKC